jgi:hypothetical protein
MRLASNKSTLSRHAFTSRTGFFGDSLTGDITDGGQGLGVGLYLLMSSCIPAVELLWRYLS